MGLIRESSIGRERYFNNVMCFFGNKNSATQTIRERFSRFDLRLLKQVHGCEVIESQAEISQADAHWSQKEELSLGIITADCMPVFIWSKTTSIIAAVHAGWRGVEQKIIVAVIKNMMKMNLDQEGSASNLVAAIGPRIHTENFEVGRDIGKRLADVARIYQQKNQSLEEIILDHPNPDKCYVNLTQMAVDQLSFCGIAQENIIIDPDNTYKSDRYHSYRESGEKAGRQISFIVREKKPSR